MTTKTDAKSAPSAHSAPSFGRVALWTTSLAVASITSVFVVELSVVTVVLTLIGLLALPPLEKQRRRLAIATLVVSALGSAAGLVRFTFTKAIAGIVEGGRRAAANAALFRLREILIAEDNMRKHAFIDPDGDGVGSAGFVSDLVAGGPLRTGRALEAPLLNYRFREIVSTRGGPALRAGSHLFYVCVPRRGGGFTTRPEDAVDEERSERNFLLYGWPAETGKDVESAFFSDEHERILVLDAPSQPFHGAATPPPCDAALGAGSASWKPWKDKKPRKTLPGDRKP